MSARWGRAARWTTSSPKDRGGFGESLIAIREVKKRSNLAEREGFEPSVPVTQDARLAISLYPTNNRISLGLLGTENACGSVACPIGAVRQSSYRVSVDLTQSGKFPPPWPHPKHIDRPPGGVATHASVGGTSATFSERLNRPTRIRSRVIRRSDRTMSLSTGAGEITLAVIPSFASCDAY